LGKRGSPNLYGFCENNAINRLDDKGLSWYNPFSWFDKEKDLSGNLMKGPWVEYPSKIHYAGQEKVGALGGRGYPMEDKWWNSDYKVYTVERIPVKVIGKGAVKGVGGSGILFWLWKKGYEFPRVWMKGAIIEAREHDKFYECRKKVQCKAKCECNGNDGEREPGQCLGSPRKRNIDSCMVEQRYMI